MTDRAALFRAIVEAPDDDAPRLVYADWLDEQGDPDQAEFIRLQCALHSSPMPDDEWRAVVARSNALQSAHGARWTRGVPGPPVIRWVGGYYRGFLRHAAADTWPDLRACWDRVFATTPLVQLTVRSIAVPDFDDFLGRVETRFLQYVFLSVDGDIDGAAVRLARDPAVAGWSVLQLWSRTDALTDVGAAALAASPYLGGLSRLHLSTGALNLDARLALQARFPDALV